MTLPNVAVIGLGCIGGSVVKALTNNGARVQGWSTSPEDSSMARALGYDAPDIALESALSDADVVVIAVPVQAIAAVAASAMRGAPASATILHCGGVQSRGALHLDDATHARILGTHPLAGSHESGFGAARAELFEGCTLSIESRSSAEQDRWSKWLWGRVGAARFDYRTAEEHDVLMTWISHLPQLASTALAATFAAEHVDPANVGPGARDTTRLAASAFEQWSALVRAQPAVLDVALAKLQGTVASLREALSHGDERALRRIWGSAREWRRAAEPSA
jgi:prephenate dehydrogenase